MAGQVHVSSAEFGGYTNEISGLPMPTWASFWDSAENADKHGMGLVGLREGDPLQGDVSS